MKEPVWLTRNIIGAVHADQIIEHGGEFGIRDEGLLEATLALPVHRRNYDSSYDLPRLAAAYGYGFLKNNVFLDGNRRVAFLAMYVFLGLNGYEIDTLETDAVYMIKDVDTGSISEQDIAEWLGSLIKPNIKKNVTTQP